MSYHTYSIVFKADKHVTELKKALSEDFRFSNIREFFTPFKGIICQTSESFKQFPFDRFPDSFFKSQNEVEEYFSATENKLIDFSRKNNDLKIAFIEMDCFGGKCASNGYLIVNGTKIFEQDVHHSGHMILLKQIDDKFNGWFFYPFTRSFFSDKGGINGEISNFSLPAIWMSFNMELGSDPEFEINVSENELQILNENRFEFYLMNLGRERIKAMGRLFSNSEENIKFIERLLTNNFEGFEHHFEIDDFETGQKYLVANFKEEKYNQISSVSYRANAFNERPFQYSEEASSTPSNQTENVEQKKEKPFQYSDETSSISSNQNENIEQDKESIWRRFIKGIFGN